MTEKEIRTLVKVVLEESGKDKLIIDADVHYQDHLFISYWRGIWDRATKQIGTVIVASVMFLFVALIGVLIWVVDPKLIGLFK